MRLDSTELQLKCSGTMSLKKWTIMMSWGKLWCACFSRTIIDGPSNITMQDHTCNHNHKLFDQTSSECHGLAIPLSRWAGEKSKSPLHSEPEQFGRGLHFSAFPQTNSMRSRCQACIAAQAGHTCYQEQKICGLKVPYLQFLNGR